MHRVVLPLLIAFLLSFGWSSAPTFQMPILAQDDDVESEATDRRPINDQMTLDEARKAIDAAAEGNDEALEKLKEGRLAYLPALLNDQRTFELGYSLMREDIGWVRDMQRWEVALGGFDSQVIEDSYEELEDRFVLPPSQLARAYMATYQLGDYATARALAERNPDSPWVLAARAWVGDIRDPARRVDLLLEILEPQLEATAWTLYISPGMFDEEVRQLRRGSNDYAVAETELYFDENGVTLIHGIPSEWNSGKFYEQLGILTHDLPRKDRDQVAEELADVIGTSEGSRYDSFAYGAFFGEPQAAYDVNFVWTHRAIVTPAMAYADRVYADKPLPRRVAAVAAFWGAPYWRPAQGRLLKEAAAANDNLVALVAVRAVLGANDDRLRALNSVARAMREDNLLEERRGAFAKALESTQHDELRAVAAYLKGNGELPTDRGNPTLNLSLAQKSSLLECFMPEHEAEAYGGVEPAYLMNLSQFSFARHDVYNATEAALQSVEVAAKAKGRRLGLTSAYLTHRTLRDFFRPEGVLDWINRWEERYPEGVKVLRNHVEAWESPTDDPDCAVYVVQQQVWRQAEASEDQRQTLAEDPSYAGGFGLNLLSFLPTNVVSPEERFAFQQRADQTTPADFHTHLQHVPRHDRFGRYSYRDWTVAEQRTLCMCLLHPYNWTSLSKLGSVLARAGCDPRCMSSLLAQATDRPVQPFLGGYAPYGLYRLLFNRNAVGELLRRNAPVIGEFIPDRWRSGYETSVHRSYWGLGWQLSMQFFPRLSPRGGFTDACFDFEFNARDRGDVNTLLNFAYEIHSVSPERAIRLVELSEEIGVNEFGRYVGSQSWIRAKAQLGDYAAAIERWREMRDTDVANGANLDFFLLHGLLEGNQWEHIDDALDEVLSYEQDDSNSIAAFALRRALMAAGRHNDVAAIEPPPWSVDHADVYNNGNYTEVFYEARRLFETGRLNELSSRAGELWSSGAQISIGVFLDSTLLRALAGKLHVQSAQAFGPDDDGYLHVATDGNLYWFRSSRTMDYRAIEILAGKRKPDDLPEISKTHMWHGMQYGERPQQDRGSGLLREGEAIARDRFVRGVIAFLADDTDEAREELRACVNENQRCSHEYHVAEWLLENQLSEPEEE